MAAFILSLSKDHLGPSAKDAGRKIGGINRMGTDPEVILKEMR